MMRFLHRRVSRLWSRRSYRSRRISRCRREAFAVCRHHRARLRVWLLFNKEQPSPFVEMLEALDVPVAKKAMMAGGVAASGAYFQTLCKAALIIRIRISTGSLKCGDWIIKSAVETLVATEYSHTVAKRNNALTSGRVARHLGSQKNQYIDFTF